MKKAILYSAMALATMSLSSCGDDFLTVEAAGAVSESTLMNDQGIEFLLTGAYSSLNGMIPGQWSNPANTLANPVFGDMLGADTNEGTQAGDQPDWNALEVYSITAANPYILQKWQAIYEVVKRCNNILSILNRTDAISNPDQIAGQAQFIKALWLFEGIRMFGAAIPYVSVEDYDANVDPQVSNVDESGNYVYIWDKVEADLKDAISKLPATWGEGNYGRATSWMAKALLGKVYLYWSSPYTGHNGTNASKLSEAKSLLSEVLNSGVDAKGQKYKMLDDYADLFAAGHDWDGESIIDIQLTLDGSSIFTSAVYGGYYTGFNNTGGTGINTGWGFIQPTYNYVNSMYVDANGLPVADFESRDVPTKFTEIYETQPDGTEKLIERSIATDLTLAVDPRLDISMGRAGVPFLDWGVAPEAAWIRSFTNAGVYVTKKHITRVSELGGQALTNFGTSNVKNHHLMRVADVKLMLAEIAIREGDLNTALSQINDVRRRAANSYITALSGVTKGSYTYQDKVNGTTHNDAAGNYIIGLYPSFSSESEAWTALKRERRAELSFEGHRFFDLARWGDVGETLGKYVAFERQYLAKYTNNPGNFTCLPIPLNEIRSAEGRFVQNEDWK
ncbi:MAG: RagB/SusD family nutrient uptake outer membrane protein [Bacteroidaceae bacterium]|nr:RagB/SusD family nutrient uptake outer membrane protein [Bacteroidaceae bacterium]